MLEECDEENSSEVYSLSDDPNKLNTSTWPANIDLKSGIKKQDQMFFNFFSVYTVESIKAQSKKEVTSDN